GRQPLPQFPDFNSLPLRSLLADPGKGFQFTWDLTIGEPHMVFIMVNEFTVTFIRRRRDTPVTRPLYVGLEGGFIRFGIIKRPTVFLLPLAMVQAHERPEIHERNVHM